MTRSQSGKSASPSADVQGPKRKRGHVAKEAVPGS
jgi:hypothetical protein